MQLAGKQLQAIQARLAPSDSTAEATQDKMPATKAGDPVLIEPNAEQQQQRSMQATEAPAAPKSGVSLGAFLAGQALQICAPERQHAEHKKFMQSGRQPTTIYSCGYQILHSQTGCT
jgi:hypothetical protein